MKYLAPTNSRKMQQILLGLTAYSKHGWNYSKNTILKMAPGGTRHVSRFSYGIMHLMT